MDYTVFISLGTNVGDRELFLKQAIDVLGCNHNIKIICTSSIYETEPVGYENQGNFLNMVIKLKTNLNPYSLLKLCLKTELELGRKRKIHWGPRTIDLDILLYNQENIKSEMLTIPHPRMFERAFVMIPLLEIEPTINLSKFGISNLLELGDGITQKGVRIWKQRNGEDVSGLFEN